MIKAMDLVVANRSPVRCYREALGQKLATRLGLAVPETRLLDLPELGRVSVQRWIDDARALTPERRAVLVREPIGMRILLLDLLVANRDRTSDNVLERNELVFPIDFNVAFSFSDDPPRVEEPAMTILRWLGIPGALALDPTGRAMLLAEVDRAEHLLSPAYLRFVVGEIPDKFLLPGERERLLAGLEARRALLRGWVWAFWHDSVEPFYRLTEALR